MITDKLVSPYAYAGITNREVKNAITSHYNIGIKRINIWGMENILNCTIKVFNNFEKEMIDVEMVKGRSRKRQYVDPRHCAMSIMYNTGDFPLSRIGAFFNGRDHTTVLNGRQQWANAMETTRRAKMIHEAIIEEITK